MMMIVMIVMRTLRGMPGSTYGQRRIQSLIRCSPWVCCPRRLSSFVSVHCSAVVVAYVVVNVVVVDDYVIVIVMMMGVVVVGLWWEWVVVVVQ